MQENNFWRKLQNGNMDGVGCPSTDCAKQGGILHKKGGRWKCTKCATTVRKDYKSTIINFDPSIAHCPQTY